MNHNVRRLFFSPCAFPLALILVSAGCTSLSDTACTQQLTSSTSAAVARFVGTRLGEQPWRRSGVADRDAFIVTGERSIGGVPILVVRPNWMTDSRPYRVACSAGDGLVAIGGFPVPDRAALALLRAANSDSLSLLGIAKDAARLFDPNATAPDVLGSQEAIARGDTGSTARAFGSDSYSTLVPRLSSDSTGVEVTLHLYSRADWSSMGGGDYWRLRMRMRHNGAIEWVDRVVVDGIWKLSQAGPDSVRVK